MFLSIIIPAYNCGKTIERLLDSILANNLDKDEYQVIICDDKSTDNFMEKVEPYKQKMNIVYCTTTRDIHCPGNTRQAALPYIEGDYFTFIDNDDMYESYGLSMVYNYLKNEKPLYTVVTNFREYFEDSDTYGHVYEGMDTDTWLHGKFFNTYNTLKIFKCYFKDDMESHEDLYFNGVNLGHLMAIGEDYTYLPIYTYKWIYNKESLSRSYFNQRYYYIDTYLKDYIVGAAYPFFDFYKDGLDSVFENFLKNQMMMTLLHAYFYYQASIYRLGEEDEFLQKNLLFILEFKNKIKNTLKITDQDILNIIYADPEKYARIKSKSIPGCNNFIEVNSFRDVMMADQYMTKE